MKTRRRTHGRVVRQCAFACAAMTVAMASSADAFEREPIRYQQPNDIFYNHYVNGAGAVPARMYVSPQPVPPNVGWTYHTYPPLYPHELMYRHQRSWYTYHQGAGWTRTKARYNTGFGLLDSLSHMRRYGYGR